MKSCALASRAARSICAWVAVGWPKAMFAATVLENRKPLLEHQPDVAPQVIQLDAADIVTIDADTTHVRVIESWDQGSAGRSCPEPVGPRIATQQPGSMWKSTPRRTLCSFL